MTLKEQVKDIFAKRGLLVEERKPRLPQYHEQDSVLIYGYLDDYHWLMVVVNETASNYAHYVIDAIVTRMDEYLSERTIYSWQSGSYEHRIEFIGKRFSSEN